MPEFDTDPRLVGALMAIGFFALERFVLRRNVGGLIRPLPFLVYFALRSILYVGVIVPAIVVVTELVSGRIGGIGGVDLLFFALIGGRREPALQRQRSPGPWRALRIRGRAVL